MNLVNEFIANIIYKKNLRSILDKKSICVRKIIVGSMVEISKYYEDKSINFLYKLNHNNLLFVDAKKILTVFNDILIFLIDNSFSDSSIWFYTNEILYKGKIYIKFKVGTNGFYISKEYLKIFFRENIEENFRILDKNIQNFSLVKKTIQLHGGEINCSSEVNIEYPNGMIEFHFTLPTSNEYFRNRATLLPKNIYQLFKYNHFFSNAKN
ncbi:hypothetical protein ACWNT8_03160 [Pigmentibacter ruber]